MFQNQVMISLALLFWFSCGIINAEQNKSIKINTDLQAPFDELCVSEKWVRLLVETPEVVVFDYSDDVGVSFILGEFPLLQEGASLDTLQHQMIQWMDGNAETIPMLTFEEEDDDSIGEVDPEFKINDMQRMEIKGIEWLQVNVSRIVKVLYYHWVDGQLVMDTPVYVPEAGEAYFAIIDNRLYYAEFSAPLELYRSFKPVFLETMQNL